eukprot:6911393-Lingulodinium_polyedra.AAC.1
MCIRDSCVFLCPGRPGATDQDIACHRRPPPGPFSLGFCRFRHDFSPLPSDLDWDSLLLQRQRVLAKCRLQLVSFLLANRGGPMSWRTDCWLGFVALLCSDKAADKDYCAQQLALGSVALASCKEQSKGSLFLQNLRRVSPLATKPVSEWAELLNPVSQNFAAADRQALEELAKETWSSLGQSKAAEDGHREVGRSSGPAG